MNASSREVGVRPTITVNLEIVEKSKRSALRGLAEASARILSMVGTIVATQVPRQPANMRRPMAVADDMIMIYSQRRLI